MHKKKFLFSNDLMTEAKILGTFKVCIGILCLGLLTYHIHMYATVGGNKSAQIKTEDSKDQNPVTNFLVWGADRRILMLILPYLDCIAFTGVILIWAAHRRMIELFQLWIISAIIFCMADMILIIPIVSYAHDKVLILASYIFSCLRKFYAIWIVQEILGGLRAEAEAQEEMDYDTSSFKRY